MIKPKVAICVPVKNSEMWLPRNLELIEQFGDEVSRVIVSYGDSTDNTLDILRRWKQISKHKVEVIHEPVSSFKVNSSAEIAFLYHDFQNMIREGDETHVLLWDDDIVYTPPDLILKLLEHNKDIIAPYVYTRHHAPGKRFYDTFVYRYKGYRYHPFEPPMHGGKLAQIDSVGCIFLSKRKPFIDNPYRDPYPHLLYCNDVRKGGYEVWVDPSIEIHHLDLERFGRGNAPVEVNTNSRFYDPAWIPPPMIKDDGTLVSGEEFVLDVIRKYVL